VKPPARTSVPPGVVIATFAGPAALAGVRTTTWVAVGVPTIVAGAPSKVTAVVPARSVPVMVTVVPPAVGPSVGVSERRSGAGTAAAVGVSQFAVARVTDPSGVLTMSPLLAAIRAKKSTCMAVASAVVPTTRRIWRMSAVIVPSARRTSRSASAVAVSVFASRVTASPRTSRPATVAVAVGVPPTGQVAVAVTAPTSSAGIPSKSTEAPAIEDVAEEPVASLVARVVMTPALTARPATGTPTAPAAMVSASVPAPDTAEAPALTEVSTAAPRIGRSNAKRTSMPVAAASPGAAKAAGMVSRFAATTSDAATPPAIHRVRAWTFKIPLRCSDAPQRRR
jgi:hypothetical protein